MNYLAFSTIYNFKLLLLGVLFLNFLLILKNKNNIKYFFKKSYFFGFGLLTFMDIIYLNISWYKYTTTSKFIFILLLVLTFQVFFDLCKYLENKNINKVINKLSNFKIK